MSEASRKPLRAVRARTTGRGIAERVREIITPTADELGYYLWDVEYVKEGADYILRVTIDNDEGITIDDCERMTRAIDPILDEHDPIPDSYLLEVSSPGIERELTRDDHFDLCVYVEVSARQYSGALFADVQYFFVIFIDNLRLDCKRFKVEDNFRHVLFYASNSGKLVLDTDV